MEIGEATTSDHYSSIQRSGLQGWGNSLIDRQIEKRIKRKEGFKILELGASSGEHLSFVQSKPVWESYTCLDLNPGASNPDLYQYLISTNLLDHQRRGG